MGNKKQAYRLKPEFKHLRELISTVALTNRNKENDINPSIVSYQGDLYFFSENAVDNLNEAGVLKLWFEQLKINNTGQTIEEAAKEYVENFAMSVKRAKEIGFIEGANWQAKKMYSKVDIYSLLDFIRNNAFETDKGWQINKIVYTNEELLEYFKNK